MDWRKNLSRNGEEPPVDDALIELARDMMPKKGQGDAEEGTSGQLNPILVRPLPTAAWRSSAASAACGQPSG